VHENADGVNAKEGFRGSWLDRDHVPNYKAETGWLAVRESSSAF
jgi:hypothetical protein